MRPRKLLCGSALVALFLCGTTACSEEEPEPKFPPSTSTPTETPTPTAEPGEPWEEKSYAGAEAFATHWFDVFSAAMPTGDTSEMREISDPACANCNVFVEQLEGYYEDGGFYQSKGWEVQQATSIKSQPVARAHVALSILRHAAKVKESSGGPVQQNDASERAFVAELDWHDGAWWMLKFEPVA